MKTKKILLLILPLIALVLELLPYGAVLNFANPEGEPWRRSYSYFSLTPFGYANFGPFLTAVLTCALFLFGVVYAVRPKKSVLTTVRVLSALAAALSLAPLSRGLRYYSPLAGAITLILLALTFVSFKKLR